MRTNQHFDQLMAGVRLLCCRKVVAAATMAAAFTMASAASGAQIGMNFVRGPNSDGPNVQNGFPNALLPDALAGVAPYAQTNWNNLGNRGTNIVLLDAFGAASGVAVNWVAGNAWSIAGGTPGALGIPDTDLMNAYLDSNGTANSTLNTNLFTQPNNNSMPLVYLTGLGAWMSAQGVSYYDLVIYADGDNQAGRPYDFWIQNAFGPVDNITFGADMTTHAFIRDYNNFLLNPVYQQVPLTSDNSRVASSGNYTVFTGLSADSLVVRTAEVNTRVPINAIQIIPRASAPGATLAPLPASQTYAGGRASFRIKAVGVVPMTFQWQKNGAPLPDGGNISGATNATLNIAAVSGADVGNYSVVVSNASGMITSTVAPLAVTSPAVGSYAEKISTSAPVAYWRLNETGDPSTNNSPAYDVIGGFNAIYGSLSQNGYNSIVGPRPAEFPGFEAGNTALQTFRSTTTPLPYPSSYVSWAVGPALNLNTNTVTVSAWIYPTANQTANTAILSARGADVNTFGWGNNAYNFLGYTWNNGQFNYVSGLSPVLNQWSFVAWVVTPTNATIYLYGANGQFSATNTVAHTNVAFGAPIMIGVDPSSTLIPQDRAFVGSIDEVAVFNRSLSPTDIADLYKKGLNISLIPTVIAAQPVSSAIFEGRNARFTVTASGEEPLTYQWRRNTGILSDGGALSGTATRSLTITGATAGNAGNYDVVVTGGAGPVTSSIATLTVVPSNAPAAYEAKLRAANPIAYWRYNEASGSLESYDYWGGNTLANANVTLGVAGPVPPEYSGIESTNTGGQFDGSSSSSAASASLMNNLAQFSVIGWFNIPAPVFAPGRIGLFGQNDVIEFGFHGNGTDGIPQVGVFTPRGSAFLNQSTNVLPGVWYLIAAVGSGTNVNLYLASTNGSGGVKVMQSSANHAASANYGVAPFPFRIGGGGILDATGNFLPGTVDEVAIFDRAISSSEFSDLFGAALSGGDLPPTISADPVSQTLYAGRTATFTVTAVGTSPQYRWRKDGVPLADGGGVTGSGTPTLMIANVAAANQGLYDVVITNRVASITSGVATLTVITPVPNSYESAVIALNPIAYYRLNETNDPSAGNVLANDFWGGLNGTYGVASQNGFTPVAGPRPADGFNIFEAANTALMTSAADSWVTTPALGLTVNTLTMTAWINPISHVDRAGIVFVRAGQAATGMNFIGTGNLNYHWLDNAATYNWDSGLNVPLNQWSFVALVVEPAQGTMYLINTSGSQSAVNVVANAVRTFSDTIRIGGDPNNVIRTVNGTIDEVAIFPYALSASQIQSLYLGTPAVSVSLGVQLIGGNVVLTWPQGTLLEANEVTGPYTTNNAASPYTTAPTAPRKFYKVIVK